jgi:peroxiredoxin
MSGEASRRRERIDAARSAAPTRTPFAFRLLVAVSILVVSLGIWQVYRNGQAAELRASQGAATGTGTQAGVGAPDFTLPAADGSRVRLSSLRGKVVLLNFWATWCPPCKAEMPDLDALQREYGQARNFTIIGVDAQESASTVGAFAASHRISFPLLLDMNDDVMTGLYAVRNLPTSLLLDRDGRIVDRWTGQLSRQQMLARLQKVW